MVTYVGPRQFEDCVRRGSHTQFSVVVILLKFCFIVPLFDLIFLSPELTSSVLPMLLGFHRKLPTHLLQ